MKVGDLVKFVGFQSPKRRQRGIIVSFDEDNDPIVAWLSSPSFTEANFRSHLRVLSEVL